MRCYISGRLGWYILGHLARYILGRLARYILGHLPRYILGHLRWYAPGRLRCYIPGRLPGCFPGHMPTLIKDQLVFGRFEQPVMSSKTPRGPDSANNLSGSLANTFPVMIMIGGG